VILYTGQADENLKVLLTRIVILQRFGSDTSSSPEIIDFTEISRMVATVATTSSDTFSHPQLQSKFYTNKTDNILFQYYLLYVCLSNRPSRADLYFLSSFARLHFLLCCRACLWVHKPGCPEHSNNANSHPEHIKDCVCHVFFDYCAPREQ
jgi:hypothetical protein